MPVQLTGVEVCAHSAGPWEYQPKRDNCARSDDELSEQCSAGSIVDANDVIICRMWDDADQITQNANLIAAAPELLALAKEYASSCISCNGFGYTVSDDGVTGRGPEDVQPTREHCGECEHIRALIAKAEGR